ncbi:MAG: DUF2569 family protein [Planctomycetota bacterium]|jgi:hypothetical protein
MISNDIEICSKCTREIDRLEQAHVFGGMIVCNECDGELRSNSRIQSLSPESELKSSGSTVLFERNSKIADKDICEVLGVDSLEVITSPQKPTTQDSNSNGTEPKSKYEGVKGWLLLFCLILSIISPTGNVVLMIVSFDQASAFFDKFPGLESVAIIECVLRVALIAFSIYAGLSLWWIRPNAVNIAKTYLQVFLGVAVLEIFLPLMAGLPPELYGDIISEGFRATFRPYIFYWLWTSYLNKSKRVKATYS